MEIPPLAALRVFDAASRQLSFTRAAESLGMTQAAVSYQIKLLEERLGGPLFLRKPKGLELTELGRRFAGPTSEAFDLLREAFSGGSGQAETLTISTMTTVAGNWLSHRLGRFQMEQPGLAVRLDTNDRLVDFARQDVDVAIRFGSGDWDGLVSHKLFSSELTPLYAPPLLDRFGPINTPEDVEALPWLNSTDSAWDEWLRCAGVEELSCAPTRRFEVDSQLHLGRMALTGEGVALLNPRFFRFELATGALIQPFETCWRCDGAYWLVYPHARRNRPAIKAFLRFLTAEIAAEDAAIAKAA
ncbi:LysR family transcriptional regulator, glycine cleavage system transcriptional activator [Paracoccus isoporae]|uniref:LysR family transcriptional regulator, glycine cleavage system transcriptional activator n=1 Tax=Paracoccus isoporae TaxID=591205 RepID=A0A1G7AED8_9RHOB|nr:LysR substrate-binding domain-containing protein [Paracoccus isoporae]SDE13308.1 LysR family transcriptional regulator, glycine cleavage system transcriptional activator [Paracoccus isoporae]